MTTLRVLTKRCIQDQAFQMYGKKMLMVDSKLNTTRTAWIAQFMKRS
jgi:hypothetical protein